MPDMWWVRRGQAERRTAEAEARADEAAAVADRLLEEHRAEWAPHWLVDGYEKVIVPPPLHFIPHLLENDGLQISAEFLHRQHCGGSRQSSAVRLREHVPV